MRKLLGAIIVVLLVYQFGRPMVETYRHYKALWDRTFGHVTTKPVKDISGVWDVQKLGDSKHWGVKWNLQHSCDNVWEDGNGLGTVRLNPDSLVWESPKGKRAFAIREQSGGYFILTYEEDVYLAVRLDNGVDN